LRPQDCKLLIRQSEYKIGREPFEVSSHLFVEPFGGNAVERGKIRIEHHLLIADEQDAAGNRLDFKQRRRVFLVNGVLPLIVTPLISAWSV